MTSVTLYFKGVVRPNAEKSAMLSFLDKPCDTGYKRYWRSYYCKFPSISLLCVCVHTHTETQKCISSLTLKRSLQSWWIKTLLGSWWCSERKWAVQWDSGVRGCLFVAFQKAIGFGWLQKQQDWTMFNHFLKVGWQMLNLGTEILMFHLSCMKLSVRELQRTSLMIVCSLWGSETVSECSSSKTKLCV